MVLQVYNDSTLFLGGFKTRWSRFKHWCLKWNFLLVPFSTVADVSVKKITVLMSILSSLQTKWKDRDPALEAFVGLICRGKDNIYYFKEATKYASTDFDQAETNDLGQAVLTPSDPIEFFDAGNFGGYILNDTAILDVLYSAANFKIIANLDPTVYPEIISDIPVLSASYELTWQS